MTWTQESVHCVVMCAMMSSGRRISAPPTAPVCHFAPLYIVCRLKNNRRRKMQFLARSSYVTDKPPDACACRCCDVKSCSLVNDCDLLVGFWDCRHSPEGSSWQCIYLIFRLAPTVSHLTPTMNGFHRAVGFIVAWLQGYNLVKITRWWTQSFGHNMANIYVTDTQTATSP